MSEHTPGPWNIERLNVTRVKSAQLSICSVHSLLDGIANDVRRAEEQANAKLIAAAPELLAALTDCEKLIVAFQSESVDFEESSIALDIARAAIKRATE